MKTTWVFRPEKLHRKKCVETMWIFRLSKLHRKKYVGKTWIFRPAKLHRKKYVETTWVFWPSKLRRKKYVETTWIFRSAKFYRKSTWKWRGNSSKFGLQRIDVISTWNRRRFDVVCPLCNLLSFSPRSSHRRCSIRKGVLRNFAKLIGKHLF